MGYNKGISYNELDNESEKNGLLLELLKENWSHGRHVESERLEFTNFFGAIVAGSLALIGNQFDLKSINCLSVLMFLLILSILGFNLSRKWGNVFDVHMDKVKNIIADLSKGYDADLSKYIVLQNYKKKEPSSLSKKIEYFLADCKRTKNLFNSFYVVTIIVWTILILITLYNNFY